MTYICYSHAYNSIFSGRPIIRGQSLEEPVTTDTRYRAQNGGKSEFFFEFIYHNNMWPKHS